VIVDHSEKLPPDLAALVLALMMRVGVEGREILLLGENLVYK
jgi:hypothetical protein